MTVMFKDAKFGDKFKTRSGLMALVLGVYPETQTVCCALEDGTIESEYRFDGTLPYEDCKDEEIVTKWDESIDDSELGKIAEDETDLYAICFADGFSSNYISNRKAAFYDGFKVGYRKAEGV